MGNGKPFVMLRRIWCCGLLLFVLLAIACSSSSTSGPQGSVERLVQVLGENGFIVQEGSYVKVDAIELLNQGVLKTANAQNAGNPYFSYALPMAPGQVYPNEVAAPGHPGKYLGYRLQPDEALLLIGRTPPEEQYFSYRSFLVTRYDAASERQEVIYTSLGDTINNLTVNGGVRSPFNQPVMILTTADRGINKRVKDSIISAGYPQEIINDDILPGQILTMGLDRQSDTFSFLSRNALPGSQAAMDAYLANPGVRVFRLTPRTSPAVAELYPRPLLKPRGTGKTEAWLQGGMDDLRAAILRYYSSRYVATELPTTQWLPESLAGLDQQVNVYAESRDTPYLWTGTGVIPSGVPAAFVLPDDPDEFLIVYGVNHQASGKATYANFTVYGAKYLNGVASVSSPSFEGSAEVYIPGHGQGRYLYAWKVARRSDGSAYCLAVPFGPQHSGFGTDPADQYGFIGFRAYLEPETTVGARWDELIYDRVIRFRKKQVP